MKIEAIEQRYSWHIKSKGQGNFWRYKITFGKWEMISMTDHKTEKLALSAAKRFIKRKIFE